VSAEPVLTSEIAELTGAIAERYAGARSDVLRLAIPPRHAATEKQPPLPWAAPGKVPPSEPGWSDYTRGAEFVDALAAGHRPRAVWTAAPGTQWPDLVASAVVTTYAAGQGALVCTPDHKDSVRVAESLTRLLGPDHHVLLSAESGPSARYRDFLAVSRGGRRIVVGTRSASFAPVHHLGLVVIWDDGDDLHSEPRAPYPNTRETLLLRAEIQKTAALVGSFSRSVEAAYLVRTGWAVDVSAPRELVRSRLTVQVAGATEQELARDPFARGARLPTAAHHAIRDGLEVGPVLVQTPRAGYAPSVACERCRRGARCAHCQGPLILTAATAPPACSWCGADHDEWRCATCGHRGLRAPVVGNSRTAEELGRTFASTFVRGSSGDHVVASVGAQREIVVATPGAEPVAQGGYAAVVLLDTWLPLARSDLRTAEESLRRWINAGALVRPGGRVVAVGDPAEPALQALVRWDPAGFTEREIAERREARMPPAARLATLTGSAGALDDALTVASFPTDAEVLGPVPHGNDGEWRVVVRVPRGQGAELSHALGELQRLRSARKLDPVRIQVDPPTL
jgi:primosomal protein N' (replication factor Y) (superfamily II helicase)